MTTTMVRHARASHYSLLQAPRLETRRAQMRRSPTYATAKGCYRELFWLQNHVKKTTLKSVRFSPSLRRDGGGGSLPLLQPLPTLSRCILLHRDFDVRRNDVVHCAPPIPLTAEQSHDLV